jgi:hypothetical protein
MRDIRGVLIDLDGVVHEQFVWWGEKAGEDGGGSAATPTPGFHQKDQFENFEHGQVCDGTISAAEAQSRMVSDWYLYWQEEVAGITPTTSATVPFGPDFAPQATATVEASPAYYTSSYHTAKYWYPASCSGWHSLSKEYLESFPTLEALLAKYPGRSESPGC